MNNTQPNKAKATLNLNLNYLASRRRTHEWVVKYAQRNEIVLAEEDERLLMTFKSEHQKKAFLSRGHSFDPYFEFE